MDIELIRETQEAVAKYGSQTKAAQALGIARSSLQNRLRKAALTGNDGLVFKPVPFGHSVKGVSTYYDADGMPRSQWVKTRTDQINLEDLVEYFKDAFRDYDGSALPVKEPEFVDSSLMTIYPIADLHIGLLSWGAESGMDWDMKIAEKVILDTYSQLISQAQPSETGLLLNLGDFWHVNDSSNATPASKHLLDVDSRYQKIIYTGVQIFLKIIDMALTKHKKVVVRNTKGNHDRDACVALNIALKLWYSKSDNVIIEDGPEQIWAKRFGVNLYGAYHGHTMKPDRAAMNLACEYAELWGKSKFRIMMHGHFHQESTKEVGNVRVMGFQTLAARDEYAASSGYCSGRSATAITLHETRGEIGRNRVNL